MKAISRESHQMRKVDRFGFPRTKEEKSVKDFQTGAVVEKGKQKGVYKGRVAVRSSGSFNNDME